MKDAELKIGKYRHPLDHMSVKSKFVRAIKARARGRTPTQYIEDKSRHLLCLEFKLELDERVTKVFERAEAETWRTP